MGTNVDTIEHAAAALTRMSTDNETPGVDAAPSEHIPHTIRSAALVSSTDHISSVDARTLNTNFHQAVHLSPRQLLVSAADMKSIILYVAHVERTQPDCHDLIGSTGKDYIAGQSGLLTFELKALWEHQYITLVLLMLLPVLRHTVFENAPKSVHKHFVDVFETTMETYLWGQSQKHGPGQHALTPLELSVRMTTLLEQSYHIVNP